MRPVVGTVCVCFAEAVSLCQSGPLGREVILSSLPSLIVGLLFPELLSGAFEIPPLMVDLSLSLSGLLPVISPSFIRYMHR